MLDRSGKGSSLLVIGLVLQGIGIMVESTAAIRDPRVVTERTEYLLDPESNVIRDLNYMLKK